MVADGGNVPFAARSRGCRPAGCGCAQQRLRRNIDEGRGGTRGRSALAASLPHPVAGPPVGRSAFSRPPSSPVASPCCSSKRGAASRPGLLRLLWSVASTLIVPIRRLADLALRAACRSLMAVDDTTIQRRLLSMSAMHLASLPLRVSFPVQVYGLKRLPKDPQLFFVGNHQIYGFDILLIQDVLYQAKGFYPRLLYDRIFHAVPVLKHLLTVLGGVVTTPANCKALMAAGQPILFYPGGVDEVLKRSNMPKYALLWDGKNGFAKMAIENSCVASVNGYRIVPFAVVGLEDCFDTWFHVSLRPILRLFGENDQTMVLPVPKFWKLRPQKMYLAFGDPVDPTIYGGNPDDPDASARLRDAVQWRVGEMTREMLLRMSREPRLLNRVKAAATRAIIRFGDWAGLNGTRLAELVGLWKAMPEIHVVEEE